jgi:Cu2+-exporting ATPase
MHSDPSLATLLDDRQEWLRFSQPHKANSSQDSDDCWDSHMVIQGMHCAACAFTVEEALMSVPLWQILEIS